MKGYKAFYKNLKGKKLQYEIGKEYTLEGELKITGHGFFFCKQISQCYKYYPKSDDTIICEIEALGDVIENEDKCCTNKIRIIREIPKEEHKNGNVGEQNIGYSNKGYFNKGNSNIGDANIGNYNKGDYNNGNYNIGIRNKTNYACGILNTKPNEIYLFDKPSGLTLEYLYTTGVIYDILCGNLTDRVRNLPNFDIDIWNKIVNKKEKKTKWKFLNMQK